MPKEAKPKRKAAEKAEKPTKSRAKKDPNAPKRALSAYMFFSQDWRERIRAENPDASFGEVGKLLGAKWKELDEEERKPYVDQATQDKVRAEDEKTAYEGGSKKSDKGEKSAPASGDDDDDDE
ncbi:high mobility group box domain-containing protein [Mycena sanguinolenta]|nr:high mobility group box domain-containing protein [Mycena sanguinolenta]